MSIASALATGRAAHLALMLDECTITRPAPPVWDPATGTYVAPPGTPVYTGRCRVQKGSTTSPEVDAGEQQVALRRYSVALPHDAQGMAEVDDTLTVTASSDTWMVGRPLTVVAVELGTARTARWIIVEDQRA